MSDNILKLENPLKMLGFKKDEIISKGGDVIGVTSDILKKISHKDNPQNVLGVIEQKWSSLPLDLNKDTFVKYQREYGAGYGPYYGDTGYFFDIDFNCDGITELATPSSEDASFGAEFDPNLNVVQWQSWYPQLDALGIANYGEATPYVAMENDPSTFYQTGTTLFNTVSLDGANEQGQFKLGYTNLNQQGILVLDDSSLYEDFNYPGSFKGHEGPSKVVKNFIKPELDNFLAVGHNNCFRIPTYE